MIVTALKVCTIALFPLITGVAALIVGGALSVSYNRLDKHFNDIAWDQVDEIRRIIYRVTPENSMFDISKPLKELRKPEFKHLEKDIEQLEKAHESFHKQLSAPYFFENKQQSLKLLLEHIQENPLITQTGQALLKSLEKEIENAIPPQKDTQALEKLQYSLNDPSKLGITQGQFTKLQKEIQNFIEIVREPTLEDKKQIFFK